MDTMKAEKMYPSGRDVESYVVSWRDGTQMKTKRYIEPSKTV